MIIVKPTFYKDFSCIAGACPDSCCQGWEVDADEASLNFYKTLDKSLEIKQRIDRVLAKDEFDNTIFTLAPKKSCPFLNDKNLCDMHIAIGAEHTPYTCRTFPRFIYDFGGTREIGVSFSCPVASDMMYSLDRFEFEQEITSELPSLNDIDAQTYYALINARKKAYAIAQNRDLPVNIRLIQLLDFACELQDKLSEYCQGDDDIDFLEVFHNPELINPEWSEKINNAKIKPVENSVANENIAMYFLYKYFMQAVYDLNALDKVKMAVVGVLAHTYFGEDSWTIHLWSKETEHSQYNMDRYKRLLSSAKCLNTEQLKNRLNNIYTR